MALWTVKTVLKDGSLYDFKVCNYSTKLEAAHFAKNYWKNIDKIISVEKY